MKKTLIITLLGLLMGHLSLAQSIPSWMDEIAGYEQPAWFNSQRVHIHTRNAQYWKPDTDLYAKYGEMVSPLGVKVFTRHVKTREDPVYWITEVGTWDELANTRNVVREAIDNAHHNECKMIAYYTHYTDSYFKENYPDWQCLDVSGQTIYHTGRGTHLCFNTPYTDSVLVRLLEVAEMGADGIYFDGKHMPSDGCWCPTCKAKFKELTGLDAPLEVDDSQLYKDYQTFNNTSIREAFMKWRRVLLAEYPELVMVIGSNILPRFTARHLNTELFRLSGAHKTEWDLAVRLMKREIMPESIPVPDVEVFRGLNYTFIRDIGDGRPAHVWIPGMSYVPWDHIQAAAAGQITFGNVANLDMKETHTPDMDFIRAIELGHTLSPVMHKSKPLRWLLIHYNEAAQELYLPDQSMAWAKNIYPMYGAYYTAQEKKLPVGFITDSQILQGMFQDAKVLFLPNMEAIAPELQVKIDEFEAAGGVVISQSPEWLWYAGNTSFENARNGLADLLDKANPQALMQSSGGNSFYHVQYYQKSSEDTIRFLAAYSNRLDWVVSESDTSKALERVAGCNPPGNVENATLTLRIDKEPLSVREVVTGQDLPWLLKDGLLIIDIPGFRFNALVEISYENHHTGKSEHQTHLSEPASLYFDSTSSRVILHNADKYAYYEIYHITGQKSAQGMISGNSIDMNNLPKGIYLIRVTEENDANEAGLRMMCIR